MIVLSSLLSHLHGGGIGKCTGPCWRKDCHRNCREQAEQHIQELCKVLYPLENTTKLNKDMMLALLLEGESQQFFLGSIQVCWRAQLRILGIGARRALRLRWGHPDERFGARRKGDPRGHNQMAYGAMYSHLWHTYSSLAEHFADEDILVDEANPLAPAPGSAKDNVASFRAA